MDSKPAARKELSLEPVDPPATGGDADRTSGDALRKPSEAARSLGPALQPASSASSADAKARGLRMATTDEFLAQAAKEYEAGEIDLALWRRAADLNPRDQSLIIAAYLRARATALQLQRKKAGHLQRPTQPALSEAERSVEAEESVGREPLQIGALLAGIDPKIKYVALAVGAIVLVAVAVWLIAVPRGGESMPVEAAAPAAGVPKPPDASVSAKPAAPSQEAVTAALAAQVAQLKQAGNWHVLVLYAVDWTRKEPNNAAAWRELSVGYARLQQFEDAFHAATKAVQLSPQDALLWRNLGHINLALERIPDAGIAFDKALALSADDPDALCGAALVAQRQGRPGDSGTLLARVKNVDAGCRINDAQSIGR